MRFYTTPATGHDLGWVAFYILDEGQVNVLCGEGGTRILAFGNKRDAIAAAVHAGGDGEVVPVRLPMFVIRILERVPLGNITRLKSIGLITDNSLQVRGVGHGLN